MTDAQQRAAAKTFAEYWKGKGYEKGESQPFWLSLLRDVYGIEHPEQFISFEEQVHLDHTSFIDGHIPSTKVLIEQKGSGKELNKAIRQSDGSLLKPFEQAKRYITELPVSQHPRWVVTCNFIEFHVYDMERPGGDPEIIKLADLPKEYYRLEFLVKQGDEHLQKEMEISIAAGDIVGLFYDAFLKEYAEPENPETLKSLNKLCVRLVFCLYAEDAGIFGRRGMFHDYLSQFDTKHMRSALIDLFRVLDQKPEQRDKYLDPDLKAFPYVNGGLFSDENIEIPYVTDEIRDLILNKASSDFDWSEISPTIFGAVFESTLNPETRRSGGMHYTSIENIHKVIDPLFLDDLKKEFADLAAISVIKTRDRKLRAFQERLASLTFLDPACGSGNFCTESYLSLRRIENDILRILTGGQITFDVGGLIKVSIGQFYGIEINDFAVTVAKTALWIAESQMMKKTEDIVHMTLDFLPLKSYEHNIVEANALRIDWNDVIPNYKLNYIMGNPPFVGNARLSQEQKDDRNKLFSNGGGELDYVSCWYKKAAIYISKQTQCAFVSTNSICQGQQVFPLWKELFENGITIDFAYKTFRWDSEAKIKAHVHCIIVGFSYGAKIQHAIFDNGKYKIANNINGYLIDAPNIFVTKRRSPLDNVPVVIKGFQPTDNGNLVLNNEEKQELILKEPMAEKWIRPFITAREYIHGVSRWCLWLVGITPAEIKKFPLIKKRVEACKEWREAQNKTGDAYKLRNSPMLMRPSSKFKEGNFIVLPRHSGEKRRYVPFGFANVGDIPGDSISLIPKAEIYHFGVLISNVHMAWMRVVCGRIKSDYRYTSDIVYNNFPWPAPTKAQKKKIEQTAQEILNARALYPDSTLAEMYDDTFMPPELRQAHQRNDIAVLQAYGFTKDSPAFSSEAACVAELMKLYQKKIEETAEK
ncbi:DNA methyltransferase [Pseudoramibacter alactolyticus]|uniref:DNA methyltransferase n=1 Tax=Pseudoramibacter alactolyticus TaxID=113287 RepID=UPI002353FEF9|nr:DNA methyltransferase [Pseudoramibacter alactolyticus]MBM6968290.1 class I SAM-dependent DNA methyltransferase [Pseudoramibacter alactolyticus]